MKGVEPDASQALRLFPGFPCVLVTTGENIITVAMVHIFSFSPPLLGIGISPHRYSYGVLKSTGEFVVNLPTSKLLSQVGYCGEYSGREVDKFAKTGLSRQNSLRVSTPGIEECPVNLECKVVKELELGDHTWFIGEVLACRVSPDYEKGDAILYWGGEYRRPGEILGRRANTKAGISF